VLVSPIADPSSPDSSIQGMPVSSPLPLKRCHAQKAYSSQIRSSRAVIMVTPVRTTGSSRITVVWPTRTPGTSVMALRGPGDTSPMVMPSSLTLALVMAGGR
jgi:hypothetical protein